MRACASNVTGNPAWSNVQSDARWKAWQCPLAALDQFVGADLSTGGSSGFARGYVCLRADKNEAKQKKLLEHVWWAQALPAYDDDALPVRPALTRVDCGMIPQGGFHPRRKPQKLPARKFCIIETLHQPLLGFGR